MNWLSCLAGILTAIAAIAHGLIGSREFMRFAPLTDDAAARQSWTQSLAGWQWVSCDLVFATLAFLMIGVTDWADNESQLLKIGAIYFAGTGLAWWATVAKAGRQVENRYLVLGQWIFCWVIAALSWLASSGS